MRWNTPEIIVAMTTFDNENLGISIPGLGRIRKKFLLIICNDNPNTKLTARQIRRMGYHGRLHIINSVANMGTMRARLSIIDFIRKMPRRPKWTVFVDDDDILTNLDLPDIGTDKFAIIQNAVEIRRRVVDLVRVMADSNRYSIDGENVVMNAPHVGLSGTLVRTDVIVDAGAVINTIAPDADVITATLGFRAPIDAVMWMFVDMYARHANPAAAPIYMNNVNYISVNMDTAPTKYGVNVKPARNGAAACRRAVAQYAALMAGALRG